MLREEDFFPWSGIWEQVTVPCGPGEESWLNAGGNRIGAAVVHDADAKNIAKPSSDAI